MMQNEEIKLDIPENWKDIMFMNLTRAINSKQEQ